MDSRRSDDAIIFGGGPERYPERGLYPRPEEAKDPLQRWLLRRYYDGRSPDSSYKKAAPVKPEDGLKLRFRHVSRLWE